MAAFDTEMLLSAFDKLINNEEAKIDETALADKEIAVAWNKLVNFITEERRTTGSEINDILQHVTRMDLIRDIVLGMESQDHAIHTIAINSKEMSISIMDAAAVSNTVSENLSKASALSNAGHETITKAFSFVDDSFKAIDNVSEQMDKVLEGTKQIGEIVNIIKRIAKQTNLLALNAGIESARAGEHGRGFSVVANEVTKLADSTRESALQIEKFISSLKMQVENSVSDMQNTAEQLKLGKNLVDSALDSIDQINESVNTITGEVIHIAASNQQQAATSQEISSETDELATTTSLLSRKTSQTAKSIFDLSSKMNNLRAFATKNMSLFTKNQMLDMYIVDHLIWRWRVYNMLLGLEKINHDSLGSYRSCRLGQWYYGQVETKIKTDPVFPMMELPHMEFHNAVTNTVQAYNKNDMLAAGQHFEEVDKYSNEVVELLTKLKD